MSVAAVAWAFEQVLPPNEKVVLLALADCENGQSLACMPGQEFLAEKASMSVRTVQRMLVSLEERGLIARDRRVREGGQRTSDSYTLALRDNLSGGRAKATTVSGGNTTTVSGTEEPEERTGSTPPTPSEDDGFEEIWKHWPKKDDKKSARRAWLAAMKAFPKNNESGFTDLRTAIIRHGDAYRATTPPKYIPMLATWLNKERWNNPLPTERGKYEPDARMQKPINDSPFDSQGALRVPAGKRAVYDDVTGRFSHFVDRDRPGESQ